MKQLRLAMALAIAMIGATAITEAQGKPSTAPVGPPSTPVTKPSTPPAPGSMTDYVCSLLSVPHLCGGS